MNDKAQRGKNQKWTTVREREKRRKGKGQRVNKQSNARTMVNMDETLNFFAMEYKTNRNEKDGMSGGKYKTERKERKQNKEGTI